jgi:hypothetical protein
MIKKWSIALLVAAGAAGLTGCEGMRVDEGAGTATNNGNIAVSPNGAALKANLSGTVVDDFGGALSGVSVYAYGRTTTTDAGGNWILTNVPVTGVNINSTAQNLEQTTDLTTQGSIYVTYNREGYAEYKSKISNPAVITHYGTAGGNPNSIIVDGLVASEAVQLPQLVNTVSGVLIDRGSYYSDPIGTYDMASNITVRLVPAVDVVNNAYGSAAQTGAGTTECYEGCGFYSVTEMVSTTDANGIFTFAKVPKIPGGYILRVDNAGYRPIDRPNDGTGYSYDYDQGPLATALNAGDAQWTVTTQSTLDPAQNYWWGIDFDVKTTGTTTFLEELYVGDYLVATQNIVEGITVGAKYGYPDENSGETGNDDGHNASITFQNENQQEIDSNLVDLGTIPLKFIFSGDMVGYSASELPERSIVIFDSTGAQLAWDTTKTSINGRTLTLQLTSKPTAGTSIYVRLHKDVFTDMAGKRLHQTVDPNKADYSIVGGAGGDQADIAEIVNDGTLAGDSANIDQVRKPFYAEYEVVYSDPIIVPKPVESFAQGSINLAIPATASLTGVAAAGTSLRALQASDWRVEELLDAVLVRALPAVNTTHVDTFSNAGNTATFLGNRATVQFAAVNDAIYRLRVRDADGITLTTMTSGTNGLGADEEDSDATVVNVGTGSSTNQIASTFIDFQASIGSQTASTTASVTLDNVAAGYLVSIVRLNDFGDEVASSAVTITLADNFEPHVAIQNSTDNGQDTQMTQGTAGLVEHATSARNNAIDSGDTSEMLFTCGIGRSDDNGEAEVGDAAYYFPKLNLSGSLYDKSNLRAHTETTGALSTAMDQGQTNFAGSAEDGTLSTASLAVSAFNTPLLATTAATDSAEGKTTSGRSDAYYTAADYDAWGKLTTTAAGPTCEYYVAEISTNTGIFQNSWLPSTSVGVGTTTGGAGSVADDDNSQTTVPTTGTLSGYTLTGNTFTYNLNTTPASTQTGNIIVGPVGCGAASSTIYDFDRTVVLNMTEAVNAPADFAAFAAQTGVCGQNNIPAGELSATTGLTAISNRTDGWNNDHLLLTFDDWRTIDDSKHFTSNTQTQVANQLSEGSSLTDLLQIVSLTDANGVAATAGNARGVHIVDATPPMATSLTLNDNGSITIKFDQGILLSDTGSTEFSLTGFDEVAETAVTYNFNITSATAGTVTRSTAYTGPFGNIIGAADGVAGNTGAIARITLSLVSAATQAAYAAGVGDQDDSPIAVAIAAAANADTNVPASVSNSQITVSINDTVVDGINVDLGSFFNPLQHTSAASLAATAGTTPSFAMAYDALQDANFNSWAEVERADAYDGADGAALGAASGPRLVGADAQGPKIQTSATSKPLNAGYDAVTAANDDVDRMFLYADTANGIAVSSIHATEVTDTDSIYTADTAAPYAVGVNLDVSLAHVWGYATTGITANVPTADSTLAVVKLNISDVDIDSAIAYIYQPTNGERVDGGTAFANTETITGVGPINGAGQATSYSGTRTDVGVIGLRDNDANNNSLDTLVIELPAPGGNTVSSGDVLVIQNLLVDGIYYSIHIPAPAAVQDTTVATATTESALPASGATVYKLVQLVNSDAVGELRTGNEFGNTTGNYRDTGSLNFNEELSGVSATWTIGTDDFANGVNAGGATDTTTDEVVTFTVTASVDSTQAEEVDYTLDAVASGSVTETATKVVGNNASLNVTATDVAGNNSTLVLTFKKGHGITTFNSGGGNNADGEDVILNTISGSAID